MNCRPTSKKSVPPPSKESKTGHLSLSYQEQPDTFMPGSFAPDGAPWFVPNRLIRGDQGIPSKRSEKMEEYAEMLLQHPKNLRCDCSRRVRTRRG
ncbi:UNVERIFIED_CONTAM: hypothetical protein PYX00_004429 [Menopon gallinae]|uniref:Uncharacterized protein n=1 Tax=Menopon gallinae TaxID=328185 RepID=A0AAW2I481_9NEOP